MTTKRFQDSRDEVDRIVHRHQLDYSLGQLRLVGLLLLAVALGSLMVNLAFGVVDSPQARLAALVGLTPALPLLPLGFSLYLLGGGHRRHRREHPWAPTLHRVLLPAGLICLVILPAVTLHDGFSLHRQRRQVLRGQEERQIRDQRALERIRVAPSAVAVARQARARGFEIPAAAGEPKTISLWRYDMAQARRRQEISHRGLSGFPLGVSAGDSQPRSPAHHPARAAGHRRRAAADAASGAGVRCSGWGSPPPSSSSTSATGPMHHERRSIDRKRTIT